MDKYGHFEKLKGLLESSGFEVGQYKDINFGLQFNVSNDDASGLVRVYEGKKGIRYDLSQVRNSDMLEMIQGAIGGGGTMKSCGVAAKSGTMGGCSAGPDEHTADSSGRLTSSSSSPDEHTSSSADPDELIGTDESGKGDYFGPLVVAGVYVDLSASSRLRSLGVDDSKRLTDKKIASLAPEIKKLCPHTVVAIGSARYNALYQKFGNLNRMLAWGHARAIEDVLDMVDCGCALSDQFGDPRLIENALMEKGRNIQLLQRPRAEENIAVAAASILARHEYVQRIKELEEKYGMELPKGASSMVLEAARNFVSRYGEEELANVAKLHFKTTGQVSMT